jgi:peptidoglycan hydrolase-like protein with peptidoglycan-binding domain
MKLQEIVANNSSVNLRDLELDRVLAGDIQTRLIKLGCLDPPADGDFGPVSDFVLRKYAEQVGVELDQIINPDLAESLLTNSEDTFLPLTLGTDFASRIVKYMRLRNYWVAKLPGFLNIVYVEGADEDGTPNADEFNKYNDRRIVFDIKNGKPRIKFNVLATTEPGRFYTDNPLNAGGAARIAFNQYKAWRVGIHYGSSATGHEALRQVGVISVHRDKNKDGIRTGDTIDVGSGFAINQHSGKNASATNIGKSSAGCLVGRDHSEHQDFMEVVKTDPRYKKASNGYMFISTIIAGDKLREMVD